ncbi:MAG: hypothetical protein ACI9VT_002518 [Psychroserpens sp.]|jgi:hypothetical protein
MNKKKPHQESEGQRVKQKIKQAIIFINIEELYVVKAKNDHSNEQKKALTRSKGQTVIYLDSQRQLQG